MNDMNERIKELAEQAGAEIYGHKDFATICVNGQDADDLMRKFAELIVQECQDRVEEYINACGEIASLPTHVILKHFRS